MVRAITKDGFLLEKGDRVEMDQPADSDNKATVGAVIEIQQPGVVRIMWKTYKGAGLETVEYSHRLIKGGAST
tara:strand:+ start:204 stop:422 length:219 start_codon:yes stop_codon:yes gene_type:complete